MNKAVEGLMFFRKKKSPLDDIKAACPSCGYLKPRCFQKCAGCGFAPTNYDEAVLCMNLSHPHLTVREVIEASDNIRYGYPAPRPSEEFKATAHAHVMNSPLIQFAIKQNRSANS